mgnify:CR=1 FL=1
MIEEIFDPLPVLGSPIRLPEHVMVVFGHVLQIGDRPPEVQGSFIDRQLSSHRFKGDRGIQRRGNKEEAAAVLGPTHGACMEHSRGDRIAGCLKQPPGGRHDLVPVMDNGLDVLHDHRRTAEGHGYGGHIQVTEVSKVVSSRVVIEVRVALARRSCEQEIDAGSVPKGIPRLVLDPRGDKKPGDGQLSYLLQGSYWDLSGSVELRVSLKNQDNEVVSSEGWIRPDTIKQRLRPKGDFGSIRDNDGLGPFRFHLTSDRGKDPVYHIGENLKLKILLGHDAWVYCFDYSPDGKVYQLFPNPLFWDKYKEPRLGGGVPIMIPDENNEQLFPFKLEVAGPPGNELIKCFAASRDVTSELPKELRGLSDDALPQNMVENLPSRFQQLPDVAISEQSFIMTIPELGQH